MFCKLNFKFFYDLARKNKLKERQISSLIGFKDEYFVALIINQIIKENHLDNKYYCKKVTANEKSGLLSRIIKYEGVDVFLRVGGDAVVFKKKDNKPLMIVECKEYIDMIRMKELIGESEIIKADIFTTTNLLKDIKFCVFSEVLELTNGWKKLFYDKNFKHGIDQTFIIRDGKRKNKENKPMRKNLEKFKEYILRFLTSSP